MLAAMAVAAEGLLAMFHMDHMADAFLLLVMELDEYLCISPMGTSVIAVPTLSSTNQFDLCCCTTVVGYR